MNEQLRELLLIEYGKLLFDFDNSKDYFYLQKNIAKRNAINTLLDVPLIDKLNLSNPPTLTTKNR